MRRAAFCLMLLATIGCVSLPWNEPAAPSNAAAAVRRQTPRTPVLPDQVTPDNAHALSQALWDELDLAGRTPACKTGCAHCSCKP